MREAGWSVAVHNDYRLGGESFTFWLFTKGNHFVKGEGQTDDDALAICAEAAAALDAAAAVDGDAQWNEAIEAAAGAIKDKIMPYRSHGMEITRTRSEAFSEAVSAIRSLKRG